MPNIVSWQVPEVCFQFFQSDDNQFFVIHLRLLLHVTKTIDSHRELNRERMKEHRQSSEHRVQELGRQCELNTQRVSKRRQSSKYRAQELDCQRKLNTQRASKHHQSSKYRAQELGRRSELNIQRMRELLQTMNNNWPEVIPLQQNLHVTRVFMK